MCSDGIITARNVLWCLAFLGFAVNYMFRININIAIVAMVRKPVRTVNTHMSECIIQPNGTLISDISSNAYSSINETETDQAGTFLWDERQQGLVLGAYFFAGWISEVPGGILAQKYGAKSVFGLSQLFSCLLCFVIPWSAYFHIYVLCFVRFLQGLIAGMSWPAMHVMTAKWIPPNERSKFISAYAGSSIGAAVTYPVAGLLIDSFNWEAIFHASGVIGVAWFIAWWFLAFDTPSKHPRISEEERAYIENSLGNSVTQEKVRTPWRKILLSGPVWVNIAAQWGALWGSYTLLTQSPTYFKEIHGWDIRMTGFLTGLPQVTKTVFAFFFSSIADHLLTGQKMSRTNVRKMATAVGVLGQGVFLFVLAFVGCDATSAVVFVMASTTVEGAIAAGPLASFVDLSPNFAGIILGVSGLVTTTSGFFSPILVGQLTYNNQSVTQWQIVFLITFGMTLVTGILHLIFGTSEIQSWNEKSYQEMKAPGAGNVHKKSTE